MVNRVFLLVVLFLALSKTAVSQVFSLSGQVVDAKTMKALPFVNISVKGTTRGTTTDLNGRFKLSGQRKGGFLVFDYVGYEKLVFEPGRGDTVIALKPTPTKLSEVVIVPGKNPADSIMERAAANRKINNPRNYPEYAYEMYNKTRVTVDDSAVYKLKESQDTLNQKFGKHLENHELLLTETYTHNAYKKPGRLQENIVANRVSGLKNPAFYFLTTQVQPFSFYEDHIDLGGKKHLSPLSRNADRDYLFILEDTLYRGKDTVFSIRFQPKAGKKFAALRGIVSINTNGYAVENVRAESALDEKTPLSINQKYQNIDGRWFPEQLNFDIEFVDLDLANAGTGLKMTGRSYIRNVVFDTSLRRRDFSAVSTRFDNGANDKSPEEWLLYRGGVLSDKEKNTYTFTDSVGEEANVDQKMKAMESIIRERVPIKFLDLDLNSIMNFNYHEGFRLGAGLYTNHKLSRFFSTGGYFAYGFRDYTTKYGGSLEFTFDQLLDIRLRTFFRNDVAAPGVSAFNRGAPSLFDSDLTPFFYNWMNNIEEYGADFEFPVLRYGRITAFGAQRTTDFTRNYRLYEFPESGDVNRLNSYESTALGFNFRYSYAEEKAEMFHTAVTTKTPNPVFDVGYTFGAAAFPEAYSDEYHKVRARVSHSRLSQKLRKTSFYIEGAYVSGTVPVIEQNTLRTVFEPGFWFYGRNAFQTVRFGEFFSDFTAQFFLHHEIINFKTGSKKFSPSIVLFQAVGWGMNNNDNRPVETGRVTRTPEHGLFESGLLIENLYKSSPDSFIPAGYGIGFYHRYGAYNEGPFLDNFAVKLVFSQL